MLNKPTDYQIQVYKLVSPDFSDLTEAKAAKFLGISQVAIARMMKRLKKTCPSLFPIRPPPAKMLRFDERTMSQNIREKF